MLQAVIRQDDLYKSYHLLYTNAETLQFVTSNLHYLVTIQQLN